MINHNFTADLLARERIADMHREANPTHLLRNEPKAERVDAEQQRPSGAVRRLFAKLSFAG